MKKLAIETEVITEESRRDRRGRMLLSEERWEELLSGYAQSELTQRDYCQEHGISVPGQVAIAGFDNLPESRVTSPPLTSVAYPVESIARLAVQSIVDRIEGAGDRPPNRILLEPHLVVRQSTDLEAVGTTKHNPSIEDGLAGRK